jgi:uncharacterized protein YegL
MKFTLRLSITLLLLALFLSVSTFAQSEKKAAYGILIDNTGTMRTQFGNVQILSNAVAQNATQRGLVSLFNFETQGTEKNPFAKVTNGIEWSQDKNTLEKYITGLKVVPGQTLLFDAIRSIAKVTDAKANSEKLSEKIIILITDGEDRASEVTEKQLLKEIKESGVKVYAIGLVTELYSEQSLFGDSSKGKATKFLKKIAKETGGNVIFPKLKKETKVEDLLTELLAQQPSGK